MEIAFALIAGTFIGMGILSAGTKIRKDDIILFGGGMSFAGLVIATTGLAMTGVAGKPWLALCCIYILGGCMVFLAVATVVDNYRNDKAKDELRLRRGTYG